MYYLVDANVFLHAIRDNIFPVADLCKKNGTEITITDTILSELEPGYYLEVDDKMAKDTYNSVYNLSHGIMGIKVIRIVNIDDIPGAKEELKRIRKRFYSWMTDIAYLNHLVLRGTISLDDIKKKSFRKKDLGECELIAIAKASEDAYEIVTDDKGRVFLHPEQNLFDDSAVGIGLTVLNSDEWLKAIGYRSKEV